MIESNAQRAESNEARRPARLFYVLDLLKILVYNHFREEKDL